jgi:hypothetical protein
LGEYVVPDVAFDEEKNEKVEEKELIFVISVHK